jgi:hypothetical protein
MQRTDAGNTAIFHKVQFGGEGSRYSVWIDKATGRAVDMERKDRLNRCYPVKKDGPTWRYLEAVVAPCIQTAGDIAP